MLSITGEDTAIGELNPIRYRGYYQDVETGLYYLQSRYYDPTTMRFINVDDPNIIQMGSAEKQELNLYAYCVNDPVNCVDPSGYIATPANVIGAIVGVIGGAVIGNAIVNHFKIGWPWRGLVVSSITALLTVVGWFAGPAIYAVIKPIVIKAITTCSVFFSTAQKWAIQLLGIGQQYIRQALRLVDYNTIRFTNTVLQHLNNSARAVPIRFIIDCIKTGKARPDPRGTSAIMYTITNFYKNGVRYNLEVLFNWSTMTVLHFKYWR